MFWPFIILRKTWVDNSWYETIISFFVIVEMVVYSHFTLLSETTRLLDFLWIQTQGVKELIISWINNWTSKEQMKYYFKNVLVIGIVWHSGLLFWYVRNLPCTIKSLLNCYRFSWRILLECLWNETPNTILCLSS